MSRVSLAPSDKVAGFSLTKHSAWESQPLMSRTKAPLSLPLGAADFSPSMGHPVQELRVLNMRALSQKSPTELSPLLAPGLGNCSMLTAISSKRSPSEYTLPACSHSLFLPRHVLSVPSLSTDWCHFLPHCRHAGVCFHPRHLRRRRCLCCDSCLQPWGAGEVWL